MNGMKTFFEFYGGLREDETAAIVLLARKKYYEGIKKSARLIDFELFNGPLTPNELTKMAKAFVKKYTEGPIITKSGTEIPLRAISISFSVNPSKKQTIAKNYVHLIVEQALNGQWDSILNKKKLLSVLIKGGYSKRHFLFDVDAPGDEGLKTAKWIIDYFGAPAIIIQTRGGYHVLMKRGNWLKKLKNFKAPQNVEWKGIGLVALPDTPRGGVMTKLL